MIIFPNDHHQIQNLLLPQFLRIKNEPTTPMRLISMIPFWNLHGAEKWLLKASKISDHQGNRRFVWIVILVANFVPSLKLTAKASEKWCLEDEFETSFLGLAYFHGLLLLVLESVTSSIPSIRTELFPLPKRLPRTCTLNPAISRVQISCSWRENFLHHQRSWNWFGPWIVNSLVKAFRWTRVICYQEVARWNDFFPGFEAPTNPWVFLLRCFFLGICRYVGVRSCQLMFA